MFKLEWFHLAIIGVLYITYEMLRQSFIVNSKMPQAVADFPVYETTEEEYNSLKQEIEPFFLDALENRRSELSLTANQLNCLSTRGINSVKGEVAGFPRYYEINYNKLIENELEYPNTFSASGYSIVVKTIEFAGTMCSTELISVNGSSPPSDQSGTSLFPLRKLGLFCYICNFDSKRMDLLAKKITIVEITDDKLIMRV